MSSNPLRAVAAAACLAVLVAGCAGTEDGDRSTPRPRLTYTGPPPGSAAPGGADPVSSGPAAAAPAAAPDAVALRAARSALESDDSKYPDHANPEIDSLHHALDLVYRDKQLTGHDTITFRAATDTSTVQLSLRDTLVVTRATLDGRQVPTRAHNNAVVFETGALEKDSVHVLVVEYHGTPTSIAAPSARSDMTTGLGWTEDDGEISAMAEPYGALTWMPCNDWAADKTLLDVRLTTPAGTVGISNGALTGRTDTAESTVTTWHLEDPTAPYVFALAIGDYQLREVPLPDGRTFSLWFRPDDARNVDRWATMAQDSYTWLVEHLGPYPYDQVGAVTVAPSSAMETTTLVTMGAESWDAQGGTVLQHELAHQWYGNSVTPKDWRDLWLNEGWAMFLQYEYLADVGQAQLMGDPADYCRESVPNDGQAGDYRPDHFAATNVYHCGAALLQELKRDVGDDTFWALARAWEDEHAHSNASRADFESFLQKRLGKDYTWLTRKWLDEVGKG